MERWVFKWLKGTLTEKGHKSPKSVEERVPSEGEMVLVKGTEAPRGTWKLAKIKKLNISADGRVRSVQIEIPNGKLLNRPVNTLYPLEIIQLNKSKSLQTKPKRKNNLELREPEMLQGDNKIKADPTSNKPREKSMEEQNRSARDQQQNSNFSQ
ncbi:hypothetical protein ACH3XW_31730 [Acanthocheilonema viteae]